MRLCGFRTARYKATAGHLEAISQLCYMHSVVLAAAWGIRTYVVEPFEVPSASMETTIMTGDRLFAER